MINNNILDELFTSYDPKINLRITALPTLDNGSVVGYPPVHSPNANQLLLDLHHNSENSLCNVIL